jgi:glutamate-1-semialdehyde 2,1-aminomutase
MKKITFSVDSLKYGEHLNSLIPGGAHTYSKGDDQFPFMSPKAITHGNGCYIHDKDGNEFIDWQMGLTSVSIGHADSRVNKAVSEEISKGVNFSRPAILEGIAAEFFLEKIAKKHDMVKFTKNGSTATTAALKLARAFTGREKIAVPREFPFFSYDDWFISGTKADGGTLPSQKKDILKFSFNDLDSIKNLFQEYPNEIACVMLEPSKFDIPKDGFLNDLFDLCEEFGALLVLDEMWCGAKLAIGGGQEYYNVDCHLATWGKGIANGFSCCALSGKKEVMELGGINLLGKPKVFLVSTTHGAESHGLAAMMSTINILEMGKGLEENFNFGLLLKEGLENIISKHDLTDTFSILGDLNVVSTIDVKDSKDYDSNFLKTYMYQEVIKRGVLYNGLFYVMLAHREKEIQYTIDVFDEVLEDISLHLKNKSDLQLIGETIKPVFRKRI